MKIGSRSNTKRNDLFDRNAIRLNDETINISVLYLLKTIFGKRKRITPQELFSDKKPNDLMTR